MRLRFQAHRAGWIGWWCFLWLCVAVAMPGCTKTPSGASSTTTAPPADHFVEVIHQAHGARAYHQHKAVRADFKVDFGQKVHLVGTMTAATDMSRTRLTLDDGSVIVFNHGDAWVASDHKMPRARFHALTWPWFMTLPFDIGAAGTHVKPLGPTTYRGGKKVPAAKMTFDSGMGDSPDDWYILFRDPQTDRLAAAAYIVTYGKTLAEAEQHPHAIVYRGFETIDGVTLATDWRFFHYDRDQGITGDALGRASLSNIRFVQPGPSLFARPAGSVAAKMPEKK